VGLFDSDYPCALVMDEWVLPAMPAAKKREQRAEFGPHRPCRDLACPDCTKPTRPTSRTVLYERRRRDRDLAEL
jgi:hypothetical protein